MEVPWRPQKCLHCKIFGHMDKNCPNKSASITTKVWIPKNKKVEIGEGSIAAEKHGENSEEVTKMKEVESAQGNKATKNVESVVRAGSVKASRTEIVKPVESAVKAGPSNRFAILTSSCGEEQDEFNGIENEVEIESEKILVVSPRKSRATTTSVAEIMKNLKVKRKGLIDKGKKQDKAGSSAMVGQNSNSSQ